MIAEALRPLSPLTVDREPAADDRWAVRASWLLVALGVLARLVRYLVDYPIWHDEAFVAASLWDRGFADLARPLEYGPDNPPDLTPDPTFDLVVPDFLALADQLGCP